MSKILIVEDDQDVQQLYKEVFIGAGYEVDSATTGEEALKKAHVLLPDLMLLDLIIPGMDGFALLEKIKGDEATKGVKVVVLTNVYADKEELFQKGAENVLLKTDYNPDQLVEKVKNILAG